MNHSELQPLLDAEIAVEGEHTAAEEKQVHALLSNIPGVQDPTIYGGLIVLRYNPLSATKSQIREALNSAGFRVSWMTSAPSSPVTDAVHPRRAAQR